MFFLGPRIPKVGYFPWRPTDGLRVVFEPSHIDWKIMYKCTFDGFNQVFKGALAPTPKRLEVDNVCVREYLV